MIRIWFFWTPSLAATVLSDLCKSSICEVVFAVSNPDKPFGRSGELRSSPVKELALTQVIPVFTPPKVRGNEQFLADIRSYECDYFVVVAYGKILPVELLDIPKKKCINIHGSILPAYRWASPIQAALLHGDEKTGVTIMEMSEGMDEGDILKIREIGIDPTETSETLFAKFALVSGKTLLDTLQELEHGGITPLPQDDTLVTYCKKIEKEDGLVNWTKNAKEIYNMWQAYTPWPGVFTYYEGKRLLLEWVSFLYHADEVRIHNPENNDIESFMPQDDRDTGKVIRLEDGSIGVTCSEWILTLRQVKLEWKKSQNIKDFVNGNQKFISYQFSIQ